MIGNVKKLVFYYWLFGRKYVEKEGSKISF